MKGIKKVRQDFTISEDVLDEFREKVPKGERSKIVERLIQCYNKNNQYKLEKTKGDLRRHEEKIKKRDEKRKEEDKKIQESRERIRAKWEEEDRNRTRQREEETQLDEAERQHLIEMIENMKLAQQQQALTEKSFDELWAETLYPHLLTLEYKTTDEIKLRKIANKRGLSYPLPISSNVLTAFTQDEKAMTNYAQRCGLGLKEFEQALLTKITEMGGVT